jgi:Cytochrome P460
MLLRSTLVFVLLAMVPQQEKVRSYPTNPEEASSRSGPEYGDGPSFTADGQMKMPMRYREWIFLSSGVDMSYSPTAAMAGHSMFDNVFVNPSSYQAFESTGRWPDKTTLVLEIRGAEGASSINKQGHTQSEQIMGVEVHVKDARLEGGWGFFEFDGPGPAKMIKRPATCYSCHESHAAVDTTFVQFYPTLLGLAKAKGTLSVAYLKDAGSK